MRISDWSSDVCSSDLCATVCFYCELSLTHCALHQIEPTGTGSTSQRYPYSEYGSSARVGGHTNGPVRLHGYNRVDGNHCNNLTGTDCVAGTPYKTQTRSEEHTSELQSLMRNSSDSF